MSEQDPQVSSAVVIDPTWKGYMGPVSVGRTEIGLHPVKTAILAGTLSVVTSLGLAGANQDAPLGPTLTYHSTSEHDYATSTTQSALTPETVITITPSKPAVPGTPAKPAIPGHPAVPASPGEPVAMDIAAVRVGNMPDVLNFDLGKTPEAQVVLNERAIDELLKRVGDLEAEGWSLKTLHIIGLASDEARIRGDNAGIGAVDPENERLAKQYGAFIRGAVIERAVQLGITIPEQSIVDGSHEVVLDKQEVGLFDRLRRDAGFATNLELLDAYKFNPESLSSHARSALSKWLDGNRGAQISAQLTKTVPGTPTPAQPAVPAVPAVPATPGTPAVEQTWELTSRCLTTERIDETTHTLTTHNQQKWPIQIVPLPWVKVRRRKNDGGAPEPQAEPEGPSVTAEAATASHRARRLPWYIRRPDESDEAFYKRYSAHQRTARRRGVALSVLTGLVALGAILTVKGDAGYCPNPDNLAEQSYGPFKDGTLLLPPRLDVWLHVPGTAISTPRVTLYQQPCPALPKQPQPSPPPQQPNCDTRTAVYLDGKQVSETETSFPGAITVTQGTGTPPTS